MWVVVVVVAACGRIDFGPVVDGAASDAVDTDGAVPLGPVLWLPMDDAPPMIVDRAAGHAVTCPTPGCPTLVAGKHGGAYRFDGTPNAFLTVPFTADLAATPAFTVAAWVTLDALVGNFQCVVSKPLGTVDFDSYAMCFDSGGSLTFYSSNNTDEDYLYGGQVEVGQWHHYAVTADGTTKRFYVDGARVATMPYGVASDTHDVLIAGDRNSGSALYQLTGAIDEVLIYSRALDDIEIESLAR